MNKNLIKHLAKQELRTRDIPPPDVLQECFDQQLNFIQDPTKRKILCLPRRSGKSTAVAIYLIYIAINQPRSLLLYVNLTKQEAKNVMWHSIFEEIFIKKNIEAELIDSKNEIRFSNGSIIYLHGIDATPKEMNKIRGKKYKLGIIDECQSYTQDLHEMVNQVLGPTMADANATICMIGTPGSNMGEHYWWILNKPNSPEKGWKFFSWTWKDNPHVRENMQKHVDQMLLDNPLVAKTTWFRQEYMGEWVPLTDARVYKSEDVNYINELPPDFLKGATFLLGVDLGFFPDPSSFCVGAYNKKYSDKFIAIESSKYHRLTVTAVADMIKSLRSKYNFKAMYIDSGAQGKQIVAELRQIHGLPLTDANKRGKFAHINLLNSDFMTQNLLILKPNNGELIKELSTLLWDEKKLKDGLYKEHDGLDNHLTDALLYCHYGSRHYWFKAPTVDETTVDEQYDQHILDVAGVKPKANPIKMIKRPWWETEGNY